MILGEEQVIFSLKFLGKNVPFIIKLKLSEHFFNEVVIVEVISDVALNVSPIFGTKNN